MALPSLVAKAVTGILATLMSNNGKVKSFDPSGRHVVARENSHMQHTKQTIEKFHW
jgi:hypothetical protein